MIFVAGIYLALKKFGSLRKELKFGKGFEVGLFTWGIASIIFTVFMALYMYQIDDEFATAILKSWDMETTIDTSMLVLSILIMGVGMTL